jgi:hypothetical protein
MSVEIVPFTEELLPDAAQLLAQRHRQNRCTHPEMAPRFEDPAHAQRAVAWANGKLGFPEHESLN